MMRGSAEKETSLPLLPQFQQFSKQTRAKTPATQAKRSVTPIVKLFLLRSTRGKSINCFETGPVRVFFLIQED